MKASILFVLIVWFVGSYAQAEKATEKLTFNDYGFAISPLEEAKAGQGTYLMMFLPATDGFAPNVNVIAQSYAEGMPAYIALSKGQFKEFGFELHSEKNVGENEVSFEYSGTSQGRKLHWYSKAVQKGRDTIYLITATSTEEQWPKVKSKLMQCVESFSFLSQKNPQKDQ
ncbi:MAG: hypothetical protein AB7F75_06670 [Planctomycetota bacterium]